MSTPISSRSLLFAAVLAAPLAAQGERAARPTVFHEAYYRHHALDDLEGARQLYTAAAADGSLPQAMRDEARRLAEVVVEELATTDFARLVPAETILYVELNRPGAQLERLVEQLGLAGDGTSLGISPKLIEGLLGVRGLAVAVTAVDPGNGRPNGVAILHPGDLDVVRGLVETVLPVHGQPVEAIGGHPTWRVEGQVFVTTTARLLLVSPDRAQIEGVVARLGGGAASRSLVDHEALASAMAMRGDDLVFFCVNLEPIMPMLAELARRETQRDPGARTALAFLDLESTRYVAGRAGIDGEGLSLDLAVELDEEHRNLAFNLMRMPPLDEQALAMVPAGVAFFAAAAVNHKGAIPAGTKGPQGEPVVSALDFGREVFANLADVALFAMPSVSRSPVGPLPDAALALRVNDPERTRALWRFLLGTAQSATGGPDAPASSTSNGVAVDRYVVQGLPVFVAVDGEHVVVSASEAVIAQAAQSRRQGATLREDPAFRSTLAALGDSCTQAFAANVGRCGELASHFMNDREKREAMPFLELLKDSSLWFKVEQSARRLAVQGRVSGIPDVKGLVEQLVEHELRGGHRRVGVATMTAPVPVAATAGTASGQVTEAAVRRLHAAGNQELVRGMLGSLQRDLAGNASQLNDIAWRLLTDAEFGNAYDDLALEMSRTSNEASGWSNWYYLDTYARALFRQGRLDEAIEMQRKAVGLGAGDARVAEAQAALEEYLAARNGKAAATAGGR